MFFKWLLATFKSNFFLNHLIICGKILKTILLRYFTCYDGDRQGLLGAYNQKCIFSLCLNMSNAVAHRSFKFEDILIKDNRNLKRIVGSEGKSNLI